MRAYWRWLREPRNGPYLALLVGATTYAAFSILILVVVS